MNASRLQRRRPQVVAYVLGAVLLITMIGTTTVAAATTTDASTPMVLQNVPLEDIVNNRLGICDGNFTHVIKNAAGPNNVRKYLNAAQTCGLQVIFTFPETVNYVNGSVNPSRVAYWVNLVKGHPALFGYLSVKEPSWHGITVAEIRSLYSAFRLADPTHPVIALLGDTPNFDSAQKPWRVGMADILAVAWYPVETAGGGCSSSGTSYVSTGPKNLTAVRDIVARKTPGTPIWMMAQTHKNLAPNCHRKQLPTQTLLRRQVREAFTYLGATGMAFHTWTNTNYAMDLRRNPTMVSWLKTIAAEVHAGSFR
ncbi:MAG: hypothetical protein ABIP77_09585 [Candidatus Limnocylindrales bacterium]